MIIIGKIDVTKIIKEKMFNGKNGTYLDITIMTSREKDQYGNDGMITQDLGKEARAKKEYGPILGNVRIVYADAPPQQKQAPATPKTTATASTPARDDGSEVPF